MDKKEFKTLAEALDDNDSLRADLKKVVEANYQYVAEHIKLRAIAEAGLDAVEHGMDSRKLQIFVERIKAWGGHA